MKTVCPAALAAFLITTSATHANAQIEPETEEQMVGGGIYIEMYDSYGDGWNGAIYTFYNTTGAVVASGTLSSGSYGIVYVYLGYGCFTISVTSGSFPSEISWNLTFTNEYVSGGAPVTGISFIEGYPTYGCTDPYACNYYSWQNANCDDGSCCYENCIKVVMSDTYGDGWEGGYLILTDNYGNTWYPSLSSGAYGEAFYCMPYGCYHVEFIPGNYPEEVHWTFFDIPTDTQIISGHPYNDDFFGIAGSCEFGLCANPAACNFNPFTTYQSASCCLDNCGFMIFYDSYGNGWNGAEYSITDWHGKVIYHGTLANHDYGYEDLCLANGCYTITTTSGDYPYEGSWTLYGSNYATLYGVLPDSQTFTVGTPISGCTDPEASNYDNAATCNDGSCTTTCPGDLDGNGYVNVSDLLLFSSVFGTYCN